jgi:hypothetical protein
MHVGYSCTPETLHPRLSIELLMRGLVKLSRISCWVRLSSTSQTMRTSGSSVRKCSHTTSHTPPTQGCLSVCVHRSPQCLDDAESISMLTIMNTYQLFMGPVATQKFESISTTSSHYHTGRLHTSISVMIVSIESDCTDYEAPNKRSDIANTPHHSDHQGRC